jgi:hypothetical protein
MQPPPSFFAPHPAANPRSSLLIVWSASMKGQSGDACYATQQFSPPFAILAR